MDATGVRLRHAGQFRVLLVDDSPDRGGALLAALKGWGFDAEHRRTGREAVEAILGYRPHAVLTELELPDMGAGELAWRAGGAGGPVFVAMAGAGRPGLERELAEAGVKHVLPKPVALDRLGLLLACENYNRPCLAERAAG